ncbi:MAG: hypothetical protein ACP59X_04450 [Solidesulfovibrio sp. DCME]|uniref:hypothetical protein n=1 Tax=Solidesulfovibrio sp. DCME TaxID=3447380 RepID=UPI003D0E5379
MKKYILLTSQQWELSPETTKALNDCDVGAIYVKSWSHVESVCTGIKFNLIVGFCNANSRRICTVIHAVNKHYRATDTAAAAVILKECKHTVNRGKYALLAYCLYRIISRQAPEASLLEAIRGGLGLSRPDSLWRQAI